MLSRAENVACLTVASKKQAPKHATKWIFDLVDLDCQPHGCKQSTSLVTLPQGDGKIQLKLTQVSQIPQQCLRLCSTLEQRLITRESLAFTLTPYSGS